jgi:hypothetical protein
LIQRLTFLLKTPNLKLKISRHKLRRIVHAIIVHCSLSTRLAILHAMRTKTGCLAGCLTKLVLYAVAAMAFMYVVTIALNPWALHIGGRSTPMLYWHGSGTVVSKDGKSYPLYVSFWPGKPGRHNGGRREGKGWSADLDGNAWICIAPGQISRLDVSGTMYGGYTSSDSSLFSFRFIDYTKAFHSRRRDRGFFDLAGSFHNRQLVLDRRNEQGIKLIEGPFIDNATAELQWSTYNDFLSTCNNPPHR